MAVGIGVNGLLYINTGTTASPTYTLVGGQRNAKIRKSKKSVDITTKGDFGWENSTGTVRGLEISFDGLIDEVDTGFLALRDVFWNNVSKLFRFITPGGVTYTGTFELDNIEEGYPYDQAVDYSATLKSKSAVTKV